jgi:hypothetical protein
LNNIANDQKPINGKKREKHLKIALFIFFALLTGTVVFFAASRKHGDIPPMPSVNIHADDIAFARNRLKKRAAGIVITDYHKTLFNLFYKLNIAEESENSSANLPALMREFEKKTQIGATAKKERYLLAGDYMTVQFKKALDKVFNEAASQGLNSVISNRTKAYQNFVKVGGTFLKKFINKGLVQNNGKLNVLPDVPEILFKRRWRVLGGLPYRYKFLKVETLIDMQFVLKNSDKTDIKKRLNAVKRIKQFDSDFDEVISTALIYFEGKNRKKALAVLKNAEKKGRSDLRIESFIEYLKKK